MTKAKKVLSLVLAVVMVAAMFAFSASAETVAGETRFSVTVDPTAPVNVGDRITVTVKLTTDYHVGPLCVPVYYDTTVFRFAENSVANKIALFGAGTDSQAYNDAEKGCVRVAFIPDPSKEVAAQVLTDATLFTFQLEAIANGTSNIGLHADDQKTETNKNGALYCGKYTSSDVTKDFAMYLTPFVINNATATVGSTAAPEIVPKDGTTGVVDSVNKYVYGVTPGDVAANYFEATNGGTLTWDIGTAQADNGTGATVTLKDSKGVEVETYTLVIFGDINGDGVINIADLTKVSAYTLGATTSLAEGVEMFAADVDGLSGINSADKAKLSAYTLGTTAAVPVNPYA